MEKTLIIKEIPLVKNGDEEDYMIVGRERERERDKLLKDDTIILSVDVLPP